MFFRLLTSVDGGGSSCGVRVAEAKLRRLFAMFEDYVDEQVDKFWDAVYFCY